MRRPGRRRSRGGTKRLDLFARGTQPPRTSDSVLRRRRTLSQSLFQVLYPSDADVAERQDNPYRQNRQAYAAVAEDQRTRLPGTPARREVQFRPAAARAVGADYRLGRSQDRVRARRPCTDRRARREHEEQPPPEGVRSTRRRSRSRSSLAPSRARGRPARRQEGEAGIGTSFSRRIQRKSFMETLVPRAAGTVLPLVRARLGLRRLPVRRREDESSANAFFASQAAQSPAGGITNLYRAAQDIEAGSRCRPARISGSSGTSGS